MSEPVFAGLPRFDAGPPRPPGSWKRPLDEDKPPAVSEIRLAVAQPKDDPEAARAAAPDLPQGPADLTQIEAALKTISARLDRIEREAQAHAIQAVQAMTAKLFPELSRQFLAEEIGRSLPKLVPASAAVIEIRAGAALADELQAHIAGMPALAHRCTVLPSGADNAGKADISWQSGGVSFDFDALFATLQAQLNPTQQMNRE